MFLVIALIIVSGCAKPECKTGADCSQKTCILSKCENKKCVYISQENCCGNKINESIENGKPGNQCTCPQDYGKCEGKGKVKVGSRMEDATYAHYYCNADNKCVLGIERKDIVPQNVLDTISPGFFKASSVANYNKPFDVKSDSFEFTVTLDDTSKDLILPVTLTKVKLLFSGEYARIEQLIAEQDLNNMLNSIGEKAVIITPLTLGYKPQEVEETGSVRYSISYVYKKRVSSGRTLSGDTIYTNETVRDTFTAPSKPVFFVRSE